MYNIALKITAKITGGTGDDDDENLIKFLPKLKDEMRKKFSELVANNPNSHLLSEKHLELINRRAKYWADRTVPMTLADANPVRTGVKISVLSRGARKTRNSSPCYSSIDDVRIGKNIKEADDPKSEEVEFQEYANREYAKILSGNKLKAADTVSEGNTKLIWDTLEHVYNVKFSGGNDIDVDSTLNDTNAWKLDAAENQGYTRCTVAENLVYNKVINNTLEGKLPRLNHAKLKTTAGIVMYSDSPKTFQIGLYITS